MKKRIKTAALVLLLLLVGLASIEVGRELFAFFIDEWTYGSFPSIIAVLTLTIGLPLMFTGLLSIWAAVSVVRKAWPKFVSLQRH
jgi:hypothetical protein